MIREVLEVFKADTRLQEHCLEDNTDFTTTSGRYSPKFY
jgi:hypothetical protein